MAELTDVREMRKAITEMSYTGNSILEGPGGYSFSAVLARHCRDAALYQGLSGEDAMTLLAYHALLSLEKANKSLLDYYNCTPVRTFVPTAPSYPNDQTKEGPA